MVCLTSSPLVISKKKKVIAPNWSTFLRFSVGPKKTKATILKLPQRKGQFGENVLAGLGGGEISIWGVPPPFSPPPPSCGPEAGVVVSKVIHLMRITEWLLRRKPPIAGCWAIFSKFSKKNCRLNVI